MRSLPSKSDRAVQRSLGQSFKPVWCCVSLVRVVIICLASTHTALVSSPSLTVVHLSTYIHTVPHLSTYLCQKNAHQFLLHVTVSAARAADSCERRRIGVAHGTRRPVPSEPRRPRGVALARRQLAGERAVADSNHC